MTERRAVRVQGASAKSATTRWQDKPYAPARSPARGRSLSVPQCSRTSGANPALRWKKALKGSGGAGAMLTVAKASTICSAGPASDNSTPGHLLEWAEEEQEPCAAG